MRWTRASRSLSGPGYNVPFAEKIKKGAGIATMSVGMITKPAQAEEIIASGKADLIAIARAAMDDPRWAWHAARELGARDALCAELRALQPGGVEALTARRNPPLPGPLPPGEREIEIESRRALQPSLP